MERPTKLFTVAAGLVVVAMAGVIISTEPAGAQGGSAGPTVTIGNPLPLPVRTVEREYEGVQASGSCTITPPVTGCSAELFTVPEGKQLVVEYFSALANTSAVGATVRVNMYTGVFHYLPLLPPAVQGPNQGGMTSGGGPVRVYVAAGRTVEGDALRSGTAGVTGLLFSMSGYLLDASPN